MNYCKDCDGRNPLCALCGGKGWLPMYWINQWPMSNIHRWSLGAMQWEVGTRVMSCLMMENRRLPSA